jgi:prepilin-type processing-associated H-X9-DG protein
MYLNGNNGHSFVLGDIPSRLDKGNNPLMWWELLQPYEGEAKQSLLCGEATEPANTTPRNAFEAWGPERFWDTPTKIRGPYVGSYAFNSWLYHPRATADGPALADSIRLPTKQATRVPVILDAARFDMPPEDTDPPRLYNTPGATGAMRWAALERHKDGVNVLFLDSHAEHVPAQGLWDLKWSDTFQPRQVTIER